MGFEDDYNPSGSVTKVNRYALGARGIDRVEVWDGTSTTYGYPLYDGHGNLRTTLARSGSSYSTGTYKTYDVWGSVRSGGDSTDPKQKYCGSLGHVADDETSLTYMRARYYEPSTGRFLSEDPSMDGSNWFGYCANDPVNYLDSGGRLKVKEHLLAYAIDFSAAMVFFITVACLANATSEKAIVMSSLAMATVCGAMALGCTDLDAAYALLIASPAILGALATWAESLKWISKRVEGSLLAFSISLSFIPVVAALLTVNGTTKDE